MTTPLQKAADMETTDPKVAIVTGASQGIGAGLVEAYHRRNYAVVANSRTISTSHDPGVLTIAGDIADPATAEQLVTRAVQRFGRADTLMSSDESSHHITLPSTLPSSVPSS
jgi:NAD(P)-dependent dehydrogenase (short-subunit alcohol dehydrogenase family)